MFEFKKGRRKAFTLVEIVIALAIIGVVVAITYPTLQANVEDLMYRVRKKVLHTRVSQALAIMGTLKDFKSGKDFVDKYRETVKLHIVCDKDKFFGCDLPMVFETTDGRIIKMPQTWDELNHKLTEMIYDDAETGLHYEYHQEDFDSISFITDNHESLNLFFNPVCKVVEDKEEHTQYFSASSVCINIIYDLNGTKPPNKVGKDIGFITVFKPVEPLVVAPVPNDEDVDYQTQSEAAGQACRLQSGKLRAPTDYELAAMFVNTNLLGLHEGYYWSTTLYNSDYAWYLWGATGLILRGPLTREDEMDLRCVAR